MRPNYGPMDPMMYYPMPPQGMRPMAPGMMQPYMVPSPMIPMQQAPPQVQDSLPTEKEPLGEILYPIIEQMDSANAAKSTGMLLEMEVEQIQKCIRVREELAKWVSEAIKVMKAMIICCIDTRCRHAELNLTKFSNSMITLHFVTSCAI